MTSLGSSCSGATAGGTLTELVAVGASDRFLTYQPDVTLWFWRWNKYTNFAMESIEQPFNNNVAFGSDVQLTLNRNGDLVHFMYVVIDLPGIKAVTPTAGVCGIGSNQFPCCDPCDPCGDGAAPEPICCPVESSPQEDDLDFGEGFVDIDNCTGLQRPWAHYTNAIGHYLVKRACLVVGGQVVDTLFSDYLYMWEELTGKPGKRLTEMIGKRFTRAQLISDSMVDRRLYVPLPFYFTKFSGNALPLISLQYHSVQVHVTFNDLKGAIQVSDCDTLVVKTRDCQPITQNDLAARLDITFIYLDVAERDKFAAGSFEHLIDQVQNAGMSLTGCQVRLQLNFNHPVIELMWAVRRRCQELCNNHFNFSGKWGRDPVKAVNLRLNNQSRFSTKEGRYFRLVQPFQHHTNIPDSFVYVYSFAKNPEKAQPSGSANFSRIDNVELIMELQDELKTEDVSVIVFGRNWNIFRFRLGLGGVAFAN